MRIDIIFQTLKILIIKLVNIIDYIVLGLIVAALLLCYSWYASIISRANQVRESLSAIDVQLKKRHDLIPNILKIASKFMEHERELIEKVTALRITQKKLVRILLVENIKELQLAYFKLN